MRIIATKVVIKTDAAFMMLCWMARRWSNWMNHTNIGPPVNENWALARRHTKNVRLTK